MLESRRIGCKRHTCEIPVNANKNSRIPSVTTPNVKKKYERKSHDDDYDDDGIVSSTLGDFVFILST